MENKERIELKRKLREISKSEYPIDNIIFPLICTAWKAKKKSLFLRYETDKTKPFSGL